MKTAKVCRLKQSRNLKDRKDATTPVDPIRFMIRERSRLREEERSSKMTPKQRRNFSYHKR